VSIFVATTPASFGVYGMTVGRPHVPDADTLARLMADAGYAGTELGPPSYFGDGAAIAELLGEYHLELVGALVPMRLSRAEAREEDSEALARTLTMLEAAAAGAPLPRVLLADALVEPDRSHHAGAIERHPETWLPEGRFATLLDAVHRSAESCRERGFEVALHPHAGTYVETPREIARVAEAMDPSLVGLCLDVGHVCFGGGDPLQVLQSYGDLVTHVHLKDVDRARLAAVLESGGGLTRARESGVFCPLGTGDARVEECLAELRNHGYDGWIVVEQERLLAPDEPLDGAVDDARANRAWLSERGLED
jgi:inosose dehydratase